MEQLREELHKFIETYGINDIKTIKKSQELDIPIVITTKKINNLEG